jgi:hypothetical protein
MGGTHLISLLPFNAPTRMVPCLELPPVRQSLPFAAARLKCGALMTLQNQQVIDLAR